MDAVQGVEILVVRGGGGGGDEGVEVPGEGVVFSVCCGCVSIVFVRARLLANGMGTEGEGSWRKEKGKGRTKLSTAYPDPRSFFQAHGSSFRRTRSCRLVLCFWSGGGRLFARGRGRLLRFCGLRCRIETFWAGVAVRVGIRSMQEGYATRIQGIGGVKRRVLRVNGPEQVLDCVGGAGWRLGLTSWLNDLIRSYLRAIRLDLKY